MPEAKATMGASARGVRVIAGLGFFRNQKLVMGMCISRVETDLGRGSMRELIPV
jgi:hypothetical protein